MMPRLHATLWLLLGLALAGTGPRVEARTLDVLQQTGNVFVGANGQGGSIGGRINLWNGSKQKNLSVKAGGFQLQAREAGSGGAYEQFVGFCVQVTASLRTSASTVAPYVEAPDLLDPMRRSLIATLYQEVWDPTGSVLHQGAFQLALWKLAHGSVTDSKGDGFDVLADTSIGAGVLSFSKSANGKANGKSFEIGTPGVFATAQGWLDRLDGQGEDWSLTGPVGNHVVFLRSQSGQDLVRAASGPINVAPPAVPLPPALLMTGAALGVLGLVGRRRSRRQATG